MMLTRQLYRRKGASHPNEIDLCQEELQPLRSTDVLIKVHAVSLNYRDINILQGGNLWGVKDNGIPTSDAAGEVISIGSDVEKLKIGDRVTPIFDQANISGDEQERQWLGGEIDGVLATHLIFPESKLCKFPGHLSWAEASLIPCAGLTAWNALNLPSFLTGQTVLLQGTGGVSLLALKIAYTAGAKIIITSSSNSKLTKIKEVYPDVETINYASATDWDEQVLRLTDHGADISIDNGGTSSLRQTLNATRRRGVVSSVGYLSRSNNSEFEGFVSRLIDRSITLRGINVGSKQDLIQLYRFLDLKKVCLADLVDRRYKFSEAKAAFEYLARGTHIGKVVIELPQGED